MGAGTSLLVNFHGAITDDYRCGPGTSVLKGDELGRTTIFAAYPFLKHIVAIESVVVYFSTMDRRSDHT